MDAWIEKGREGRMHGWRKGEKEGCIDGNFLSFSHSL